MAEVGKIKRLLIPACAWADGWNDAEYQRIEQSIQLPGIKQAAKKYAISAISFPFFNGAKIQKISDMRNILPIKLTFFM